MRSTFLLASLVAASALYAAPIELRVASFDPAQGTPTFNASLMTADFQRVGLFIVQFPSVVGEAERARVAEAGGTVLDYLPQNAFLVRGDRFALQAIDGVRWVGPFHPAYRLDPSIGQRTFNSSERLAEIAKGLRRVSVTLTRDANPELSRIMIEGLGVTVRSEGMIGDQGVLIVTGTMEQIQNIARNETVQFIEEAGERTYRNNTSRWIVQSNVTNSTPLYTAGITGQGMIIGILDGLVKSDHTSFSDTVAIGPTHRKIVYAGALSPVNAHGTHVAGTAAGDAGVFDDRRGVAYGAKIAFSSDPADTTETTLYNLFVTHQNQGARDHTNSWGDDGTTLYNNWCRAIDRFSWDYEDSMVAFAITNLTSQLKNPENAKSCLSVGATMDSPNQANNPAGFSGPGPTADGRRKPEVCAPGEGIISSGTSSTTALATMSGTSMASPAATASGTLIRQFLKEGRIYNGNPNAAYTVNASGALLRAMLINSSVDMTGTAGYPSNREGFGRVLIDNVLALPGEARRSVVYDVRNANGFTTGQSTTYRFQVTSATDPLRVSLAFTDYPAAASASPASVNNIDLSVTSPTASTYKGNALSGGVSVTGGTFDALNSTEIVILPTPALGIYTVTVTGTAVVAGPKQGYALVINGNVVRSRVTGTLNFGDWVGAIPSSVNCTFLNSAGTPYAGGSVTASVNTVTKVFTVEAPPTVTGSYRLRFDFGSHLLKTTPGTSSAASTDYFANLGTVNLINGDPDRSGEVDAVDIDLVISNFGQTGVPATQGDVDGSGEVDAVDIDVVIANFGAVAS